jgi:hypothetical protein
MATAGTYTITRQATDQYDFTVPGNPVIGTQIYFTTGQGNQGSVFVPQSQYKETVIHSLVASYAKALDTVGGMTGTY